MGTFGYVLCPHLKGTAEGTSCVAAGAFIKDMEGVNIRLCMSQRHETCAIYMQSLQNMIEHGTYSNISTAEIIK